MAAALAGAALAVIAGTALADPDLFVGPTGLPTILSSVFATRSVNDSTVIPAPEPTFGGAIGKVVSGSKAWWAPQIAPPKTAPNVLIVQIDDEGYGASSTFGGMIPMPYQDRLAKEGLRYTNFHTTALCCPTRAALLTGRNHHSVGFGDVSEVSTGFPGYNSTIEGDTATIGRLLQANGYATSWFGKDHNVPAWQSTAVGPFNQWPVGMGFDYFYGFIGGDTDQWHPTVYENTSPIFPYEGRKEYNLNIDLADKAIAWLNRSTSLEPNKPVFMYYAPGATHAPHQPTAEWIAKFKGKFDYGWNAYRDYTFKRQLELGVIPKGTKLTPWPDDLLKQWDALSPLEKKVYAHQMEVFAAYLAETDYEIGRVVDAFKATKRYDNTLIVYMNGDNGASAEGTPTGTFSEYQMFNGLGMSVEQMAKLLPEWGGPTSYPHYAVPWAWAMDTPFRWTKQVAAYFGGTRNGMVVVWPGHIGDPGGVRNQFTHVIDVMPTILEAAGIVQPDSVDGWKQRPIEGTSFYYTFDKANAGVPSRHHTQYFEMFGARAMYQDGWIATTDPFTPPWLIAVAKPNPDPWNNATWHLYHVAPDADWSEYEDVAQQYPDRLKDLQALFAQEAAAHHVLPLDTSPSILNPRPSLVGPRTDVTYLPGVTALLPANTPNIMDRSYGIVADVDLKTNRDSGAIVSCGGVYGGYALWMDAGKPAFSYNLVTLETYRWKGQNAVAPGRHQIEFDFAYDGGGLGKGGTGTLKVDGTAVASKHIDRTIGYIFPWDDGLSIGQDTATAVDDQYQAPFPFTGSVRSVSFHLGPLQMSRGEGERLKSVRRAAEDAYE
ncbi:MAG: arylsulfatase [Candidatus Eremiobacteraeota bacterium]|nr:arylsulfatase [Candidatus Eremiobacteraeota bacterium]